MFNKNFSYKFQSLLAAATVAASLGTMSAQDNAMRADVPFAFSVSRDAKLPSGRYIVSMRDRFLRFRNNETGESVYSLIAIARKGKPNEEPSLTFLCRGSNCRLDTVRAGGENTGVQAPAYKLSNSGEEARLVSVPLVAVSSR